MNQTIDANRSEPAIPEAADASPASDPRTLGEQLTSAYAAIMLFALPLVMHDGFFDITEAKWVFYCAVSAAYLLLLAILRAVSALRGGARARPAAGDAAGVVCMLLFAAAFVLAALVNGSFPADILARHNRWQGILTACLYAGVYIALAMHFRPSRIPLLALIAGFCLATLLAAMNDFGLDPLHVFPRLIPFDRGRYISTLGNVNFYSGYLCLLLPAVLTLWCHAETTFGQVATGFALVCGALGMLPSGSESLLAGLLAAGLTLPLALMHNPRALRRLFAGCMLMLAALALAALPARGIPLYQHPSFFIRSLTRPPVLLGLFAFCAILFLLARRCSADRLRRLRKPYAVALCAGLLLTLLFLLLANTQLKHVSFGIWEPFIKWGPGWGTDRGRIWAYCADVFARYDIAQTLFGGGTGALYALDSNMAFFGDAILDNAHNEYLHYLITVGVFGLAAYLGALFCTLRAALRAQKHRPLSLALAFGIIGCAAQAFFSIAQPVSTPLLFLFMGMAAGTAREARSPLCKQPSHAAEQ